MGTGGHEVHPYGFGYRNTEHTPMSAKDAAPGIAAEGIEFLRTLRQSRRFTDEAVPDDVLADLLEVARWTGSAKNGQPWEFIVVDDRETLKQLARAGEFSGFLAGAALAIVIVLDGTSPRSEAYDEGRVSERLMLAARLHGLGSGTGWFSGPEPQAKVRTLLGIPDGRDVWSAVGIGYVADRLDPTLRAVNRGRKPLSEIVSYGAYDRRNP
jgi:nitroreductase